MTRLKRLASRFRLSKPLRGMGFRNLLTSYLFPSLILVLVSLLVVSVWFFSQVDSYIGRTVHAANEAAMQRVSAGLRDTFEELTNIAHEMEGIAAFSPATFRRAALESIQALSHYGFLSNHFDSVMIYYADMARVLTVGGVHDLTLPIFFNELSGRGRLLRDMAACKEPTLLSTLQYGAQHSEGQLLYVCPLPTFSKTPRYFALFLIRHESLLQAVRQVDAGAGYHFLLNSAGDLLWSSHALDANALAALREAAGRADGPIDFQGSPYFYGESAFWEGLTLLRLADASPSLAILRKARIYFVLCCLLIACTGGLALRQALKRGYRPLRSIVDAVLSAQKGQALQPVSELDALEQMATNARFLASPVRAATGSFDLEELRGLFVYNAIQGRYPTREAFDHLRENLQLRLTGRYFYACCVLLQAPAEEGRGAIVSHTAALSEDRAHFYVGLDGRTIVGILCGDDPSPAARAGHGKRVLDCFPPQYRATIALGSGHEDFDQISRSYLEARIALDYRLIEGIHTVLLFDTLPVAASYAPPPEALLDRFQRSMHAWDVEGITGQLEELSDYIVSHSMPLHQVRCICYDLISIFVREAWQVNRRAAETIQQECDIFSLSEFHAIDDLFDMMLRLSGQIAAFQRQHTRRTDELFYEECRAYLQLNLRDPQFSLDRAAEHFGLSPQALRRRFKEASGQTMHEALSRLRMERACDLLRESDLDLAAITQAVGLNNVSSFVRKFSQDQGMTPGKYRERCRGERA